MDVMSGKRYCGHWSDAELRATLDFKMRQAENARRELRDLEQNILDIQTEQRERLGSKS